MIYEPSTATEQETERLVTRRGVAYGLFVCAAATLLALAAGTAKHSADQDRYRAAQAVISESTDAGTPDSNGFVYIGVVSYSYQGVRHTAEMVVGHTAYLTKTAKVWVDTRNGGALWDRSVTGNQSPITNIFHWTVTGLILGSIFGVFVANCYPSFYRWRTKGER